MTKNTTEFICQSCGYKSPKWLGKCPSCSQWDSLTEESVISKKQGAHKSSKTATKPIELMKIEFEGARLFSSKIPEFDRVLGGGFTSNSTILVSGDPGIGKSTLLLQVMGRLATGKQNCLYITGEESPRQIKMRSERLGAQGESLLVFSETNCEAIVDAINEVKPDVITVDSIQTLYTQDLDSAPGSISQIRECASRLIQLAKEKNICIFFVGHVTKDHQIAGPMTLEHMVDTVIYFEGDLKSQYRILRATKNRFGTTNEIGIFEMVENGLKEVTDPSLIFLSETCEKSPGSIAMANMEGTRPILIEVQALCSASNYSVPTRISTGIDRNRILLLVAILEKRLGLNLTQQDIYINITGGFRVDERAGDLPCACAIVSSLLNKTMPRKTFLFGEIGLTGEIRGSRFPEKRLVEGTKLGFERCIMPIENLKNINNKTTGIEVIGIKSVDEIIDKIF